MQILCLGDVALADPSLDSIIWEVPGSFAPDSENRILFNWEFPIGQVANPKPRVRGMRFLAYPGSPSVIQKWAPGVATLATNHVLDAEEKGIIQTIQALHGKGFQTVGAGITVEEITKPLFWETAEGSLAIINWVFAETHPDWQSVPGPNCWPGLDKARALVQSLKDRVSWVLVVAHWSDELFPYPSRQEREIARQLAGSGVDVIIGHHPHVVRGMEIIGATPVFYSLGNFYFAEKIYAEPTKMAPLAPRNRECLGVRLIFKECEAPQYEMLSFWNQESRTKPDPLKRAFRRVKSTSRVLNRYHGEVYSNWYNVERARFDKWGSRWHFGLRKRGLLETLRRAILRYRFSK